MTTLTDEELIERAEAALATARRDAANEAIEKAAQALEDEVCYDSSAIVRALKDTIT